MTSYAQSERGFSQSAQSPGVVTDRRHHAVAFGGFGLSAVIGAGVTVLALIALGGQYPIILTSIAVIGVGGMLFFEALGAYGHYRRARMATLGGADKAFGLLGLGLELVGAGGAVVLGILALTGIAPLMLLDIAAIGFGAALALGAGSVFYFGQASGPARRIDDVAVRSLAATYAACRPVAGGGAALLGIIGLFAVGRPHALLLVIVSLLAVGTGVLLGGFAAVGGHVKHAMVH